MDSYSVIILSVSAAVLIIQSICVCCCKRKEIRKFLPSSSSSPPPVQSPPVQSHSISPDLSPETVQLITNTHLNSRADVLARLSSLEQQVQKVTIASNVLVQEVAKIKKTQLKSSPERFSTNNQAGVAQNTSATQTIQLFVPVTPTE